MPVDIPRQALVLLLMSQGPTNLPSYMSIYKYAHLYRPFLYTPLHRLKQQIFLLKRLACAQSEKDNLLPGLTPHTPAPEISAILDPPIYQTSPLD
jgi:hypothetical protein